MHANQWTRRKKPTNIRLKRIKTPPRDVMGSDEPMPWFERAWLSRSTLSIASTGTLGNPGVPHGPTAHGTCIRRGLGLVIFCGRACMGVRARMTSRLGVGVGLGTVLGVGLDLHARGRGRVGVWAWAWAWAWIWACVCGFGFGLRVERLHHRNQINDEPYTIYGRPRG